MKNGWEYNNRRHEKTFERNAQRFETVCFSMPNIIIFIIIIGFLFCIRQIEFKNNTAAEGDDIFITPPRLICPELRFVEGDRQVEDRSSGVIAAKARTPMMFLMFDGASPMCRKKIGKTMWLWKDCNTSIWDLHR